MTVTAKNLVPAKTVEATQTTQYIANGVTTIIDKFIVKQRTLAASETYIFPELVGQILPSGGFISTIAGTASAINMRVSGREVS
jgi:hypothetical protein